MTNSHPGFHGRGVCIPLPDQEDLDHAIESVDEAQKASSVFTEE